MTDWKSWEGDWHARVIQRAREKGHESVTAFADARPLASTLALADELGADDVNASQVITVLRQEAERGGFVDRFSRSHLARRIHERLPDGWGEMVITPPDVDGPRIRLAGALAAWITDLPENRQDDARGIAHALIDADLPDGWLPEGPDDPVLGAFFDRARGNGSA
jgi:hypothetical protein